MTISFELEPWWQQQPPAPPWTQTTDLYTILIGEVMAQQTQLMRAQARWEIWIDQWPTAASLADASLQDVLRCWQGLGYPRRAKNLHSTACIVAEKGWPSDLTTLPGIGQYTAAALECFGRGNPILPRDINVSRVLMRAYGNHEPAISDYRLATNAFMRIGQSWCRRTPLCNECPLSLECPVAQGAVDPVKHPPTQSQFEGSFRQARGILLKQILANNDGIPRQAVDKAVMQSLIDDGLIQLRSGKLYPPL